MSGSSKIVDLNSSGGSTSSGLGGTYGLYPSGIMKVYSPKLTAPSGAKSGILSPLLSLIGFPSISKIIFSSPVRKSTDVRTSSPSSSSSSSSYKPLIFSSPPLSFISCCRLVGEEEEVVAASLRYTCHSGEPSTMCGFIRSDQSICSSIGIELQKVSNAAKLGMSTSISRRDSFTPTAPLSKRQLLSLSPALAPIVRIHSCTSSTAAYFDPYLQSIDHRAVTVGLVELLEPLLESSSRAFTTKDGNERELKGFEEAREPCDTLLYSEERFGQNVPMKAGEDIV
mmetsp:Transcript_698/g.1092  ORF Transcript_698/g.1092 Transcript_698/m.1092 type:complete len:283 (-) Transcript_698:208-1056(-)